ncbi:reverse transcriptase domain-containing protein [Paenibacillus polymyxa]
MRCGAKIEEGSLQGGPLSPLLANIYLNEFDQKMKNRDVNVIRYADDIVVLAKSKRAATRLLEFSRMMLEQKLKLQMHAQKSKVVRVLAQKQRQLHSNVETPYTEHGSVRGRLLNS